jgi:hypothetical protein
VTNKKLVSRGRRQATTRQSRPRTPILEGLDPAEARVELEIRRGHDRRLRQRALLEASFAKGKVSYTGQDGTRKLEGGARRTFEILCGLYVAAPRSSDVLAYELALDDAPDILVRMSVPVLRNGTWTRIEIEPGAYQYGLRFFERGIAWAQAQEREERRRAKAKTAAA